ncbi:MAG: tetratricopeptide repeat protein [Actinobacteria bacterium]|nr:tetratricopeptide repeat protein [Actinomycetota bacterium]
MATCDVCDRATSRADLTVVTAADMKRSVHRAFKPFDPFEHGLIGGALRDKYGRAALGLQVAHAIDTGTEVTGTPDPFDAWRTIVVDHTETDWGLCPDCIGTFRELVATNAEGNRAVAGCLVSILGLVGAVIGAVGLFNLDGESPTQALLFLFAGLALFAGPIALAVRSATRQRRAAAEAGETGRRAEPARETAALRPIDPLPGPLPGIEFIAGTPSIEGGGAGAFRSALGHWNAQRYGAAIDLYEQAIRMGLDPESEAAARLNLGQSYLHEGDLAAAASAFAAALSLTPQRASTAHDCAAYLSAIYEGAGMAGDAAAAAAVAARAAPHLDYTLSSKALADLRARARSEYGR